MQHHTFTCSATPARYPHRTGRCNARALMRALLIGTLWAASAALAGGAEFAPLGPAGAPASAFPKPDRPVAEIISPIWANEKGRDATDEVGEVAGLMGLKAGMAIADIGAGSGYYTVRLAKLVGPDGRVYAQDITPGYLRGLRKRVDGLSLGNVTLSLGEGHDPRLAPRSLDAAVLVHMYHEIAQPYAFMHNLIPALKPGARVGIIDLDRKPEDHGTPPALLRCELAAVGYREIGFHQLKGDTGYLAIFEAPLDALPPSAIKACSDRSRSR